MRVHRLEPGIQLPRAVPFCAGLQRLRLRDANAPLPPAFDGRPDPGVNVLRQTETAGRIEASPFEVTVRGGIAPPVTGMASLLATMSGVVTSLSNAVLLAAAAAAAGGSSGQSPQETIRAVKDFQETLGLGRTRNFELPSVNDVAAARCYYAPKLELPFSCDELRWENAGGGGCRIDESLYDVFYYPMEAVASGSSPVTSSLAASPLERMLVVVTHEDFHQHHDDSKLPAVAAEAASTLAGFLTAAEFARRRYGDGAELTRRLSAEADLFLVKSLIVNAHRERVQRLYESVAAGTVPRQPAPALKRRIFEELGRECLAVDGTPSSFNKCPGALNHAGLAFDYTYTRNYPLVHRLYAALGRDRRAALGALRELLALRIQREADFAAAAAERIAAAAATPASGTATPAGSRR